MTPSTTILICGHCGNKTPHEIIFEHSHNRLFDEIDGKKVFETFKYCCVKCATCKGISLLGGFKPEVLDLIQLYPRLYPKSGELGRGVPERIRRIYNEIWPIKQKAPGAFAGQIRRALEYLCSEQKAGGRTLVDQLRFLSDKGVLPETLAQMTDLIRKVGNIGVHASEEDIDVWDAELIDEFFRSVVEYVYVAPRKVELLRQKLKGS